MNTTEFATAIGTDPRTARKFLRSVTDKADQPGKGARWEIKGDKRTLATMGKKFAEWQKAREEAKALAEAEAATEVESDN